MRRHALLLMLLLLAGAASAQDNSTEREDDCGAGAAFEQLITKYGDASRFGEFRVLLEVANLESYLETISQDKAIIIPTNGQVQKLVKDSGIDTFIPWYGEVNKPGFETSLTMGQVAGLRRLLATFVIPRYELRTKFIGPYCELLAYTRDYHRPSATMQQIGNGRDPWRTNQTDAPPEDNASTGGAVRKLLQNDDGEMWPNSVANSVHLGYGYNSLTGWPLMASMASSDPGFDPGNAIFDLTAPLNGAEFTWSVTSNSGCVSNQQEVSSYSQYDAQQQQTLKIGLSGGYKKNAFSANSAFQTDLNTNNLQAFYTVAAGSYVNNATFTLATLGMVNMTEEFFVQVDPIYQAVKNQMDSGQADPSLQASIVDLVNQFGTHYIREITSGAISRIFTQMSAASNAQLENNGINVSASASATYKGVTAGASGGGSNQVSNYVQQSSYQKTVRTSLVPSGLPVPYTTDDDGTPDCNSWTKSLQDQSGTGNYAKLLSDGSLVPIANIFSNNGNASEDVFTLWWPADYENSVLMEVAQKVEEVIQNCQGLGCLGINTACVPGSFNDGAPENPCQSCYTTGDLCNPYTTESCSATTGACNCLNPGAGHPWYAQAPWEGTDCFKANTGQCYSYYNAGQAKCYQSSAFVDVDGDSGYGCPFGYVGNPKNCGDGTECMCRCTTTDMEQYWWPYYNQSLTNSYVIPGSPSYPNAADYAGEFMPGECGNDANTGSCPGHVDYCSCPSPGGWGNGCNPLKWYDDYNNDADY